MRAPAAGPIRVMLIDDHAVVRSALRLLIESQPGMKAVGAAGKARVLVLTGVTDPEVHVRAMRLGAMGVVLKEKASEVLIKAIEKVNEGEIWFDRSLLANVFSERPRTGEAKKRGPEAAKAATLT